MADDKDRLEREINEILDKIEQFPTPERRRNRAFKRHLRRVGDQVSARQRVVARVLSRVSLSQLVLLSFLLILGSFFFRGFGLGQWVLFAGVALLSSPAARCWSSAAARAAAPARSSGEAARSRTSPRPSRRASAAGSPPANRASSR